MNRTLELKNEKIIHPKPIIYPVFEHVDEAPSVNSVECYNALIGLIKDELGSDYDSLKGKYKFTPGLFEDSGHTE